MPSRQASPVCSKLSTIISFRHENARMKPTQAPKTPRTEAGERKAYVKPEFRHESVFETMALACGKVNGTQSACRSRRNAS